VKKILHDEKLPQPLRHHLAGHEVSTVGFMGWSGTKNGELITLIDGTFDIFITGDQNLRYQQNLKQRKVCIIELPATRLDELLPLLPQILSAIESSSNGSYTRI
jgi:hypothetical protein